MSSQHPRESGLARAADSERDGKPVGPGSDPASLVAISPDDTARSSEVPDVETQAAWDKVRSGKMKSAHAEARDVFVGRFVERLERDIDRLAKSIDQRDDWMMGKDTRIRSLEDKIDGLHDSLRSSESQLEGLKVRTGAFKGLKVATALIVTLTGAGMGYFNPLESGATVLQCSFGIAFTMVFACAALLWAVLEFRT